MGSMEGMRVLVTGAGTGIGKGIAEEFAHEGATVVLHYSHSSAGAIAAAHAIVAAGGKAEAMPADFSRRDEVRGLAARALSFLGGIDVLVNNAGVSLTLPFEQVTGEQFDLLYAVNVSAPFFLTQALLPRLCESKNASVINLSSIHAYEGAPEYAVYAGTRGAILAFTRELAIELAPLGIRVNGIAPGSTNVESHRKVASSAELEAEGRGIPVGRLGTPQDMGKVAVFLASEGARFIVGQTIVVDGGTISWMPFGEQFRRRAPKEYRLGQGYVPGM